MTGIVSLCDFSRLLREAVEPARAASAEAAASPAAPKAPPHPKRSPRRVTLASARKQAERAGFSVAAAEFYPDGRLRRLEFCAPDPAPIEIDTPEQLRRLI